VDETPKLKEASMNLVITIVATAIAIFLVLGIDRFASDDWYDNRFFTFKRFRKFLVQKCKNRRQCFHVLA
jgi:hypothetical protein